MQKKSFKRIGVLTSGGDCPGMNAAIRAVTRTALHYGLEVYGVAKGYSGLIGGELSPLGARSVSGIVQRGGTMLMTARSPEFATRAGLAKAVNVAKTYRLDAVVVIGGNGSLTGAKALANAGVPVMGLPGTIDNDLAYTDWTIGFDTAVNTALSAISNIRDTSAAHERIAVIEVMGRDCGDIALHAGLAGGAEVILTPEKPLDVDAVCRTILDGANNKGKTSSIVVKAEGVPMSTAELCSEIEKRTGHETRATVLGYLQRGGTPTARDRVLASRCGHHAARLLAEEGLANQAIGVKDGRIINMEIGEALAMPKKPPVELAEIAKVLAE